MPTLFKTLAGLLEKVESTKSRLQMISLVAAFLKALEPEEVEPAVSLVLGRAFPKWSQKTLDVSWVILSRIFLRIAGVDWGLFGKAFSETGDIGSAVMEVFEKSKLRRQAVLFEKPLTLLEVRRSLEAIADSEGSGSREKKDRLISSLLSQSSPLEAKYLVRVFVGEMRTGFHEGLIEHAVAKAFDIPIGLIRNSSMALGDIGEVAEIARTSGEAGLQKVGFKVFRPVKLMLAQVTKDVDEALKEHGGEAAFEYKYDGARVQIHKLGDQVRIFSRRLTNVTLSLPEIVDLVKSNVTAGQVILEGEVIAIGSSGTPIAFQHLMRRFKRVHEVSGAAEKIPLRLFLFDVLFLNDESLIHLPYTRRRQLLAEVAGEISLAEQIVSGNLTEVETFLKAAMTVGHEGLMAKKLDGDYTPGVRGKGWLKIKPVLEPLDLVITAAEYGYGRRHGWLSDYYLGARDEVTGEFFVVGKTFKGLTDLEIIEMTKRLKTIAVSEERNRVVVLPKIVVEVAYNEIQKSPKYPSEMALRFARITRVREDKSAGDADTIQRVRMIYERQFAKKGRYKTE
jgi:DNA ligase 1